MGLIARRAGTLVSRRLVINGEDTGATAVFSVPDIQTLRRIDRLRREGIGLELEEEERQKIQADRARKVTSLVLASLTGFWRDEEQTEPFELERDDEGYISEADWASLTPYADALVEGMLELSSVGSYELEKNS